MNDEIFVVENFLSKEECQQNIEMIDQLIAGGLQHEISSTTSRKDECIYMNLVSASAMKDMDVIGKRLMDVAIPAYTDMFPVLKNHILGIQEVKAQKTPPGGGFHDWHCESISGHYSDRALAWTIYLNDDFSAGETEFLHQQMRIIPKAGMLSIFPCSFLHTHRGNPPHGASKYIFTGWVIDLDPYGARYKFKDA